MSVFDRTRVTTAAATLAIAFGAGHVMQFGFATGFALGVDPAQPAPRPSRTRPDNAGSGSSWHHSPLLPSPVSEMATEGEVPPEPQAAVEPAGFPASALAPLQVPDDASVLSLSATGVRAEALGTICQVLATAEAAPGAVIEVELDACERDVPVSVSHAGLSFTEATGSDGRMTTKIPAFGADGEVEMSVAGQPPITVSVAVPDAELYDRVALVWNGRAALSIRALEHGAAPGRAGHVSTEHPQSPARAEAAEGGYLMVLGDPTLADPALAEVYSFPSGRVSGAGTVELSVSAAVTEASCGRDVPVRILQSHAGARPRDTMFSVAFPGCEAVGQHLVLKKPARRPESRSELEQRFTRPMRHAILAALAAAGTIAAPQVIAAEPVTLAPPGGGLEITGRLLSYDGDTYRDRHGLWRPDRCRGSCGLHRRGLSGPRTLLCRSHGLRCIGGRVQSSCPPFLRPMPTSMGWPSFDSRRMRRTFLYVITGQGDRRGCGANPISGDKFGRGVCRSGLRDSGRGPRPCATRQRPSGPVRLRPGLGISPPHLEAVFWRLMHLWPWWRPRTRPGDIALGDLVRVLRGDIQSWAALGGPDEPIALHLPPGGSALEAGVAARLLSSDGPSVAAATRHISLAALDAAVAADPLALGVTAYSGASAARRLAIRGSCDIPLVPEPFAIKTEDYPLTAPHFVFTPDLRASGVSARIPRLHALARGPGCDPRGGICRSGHCAPPP